MEKSDSELLLSYYNQLLQTTVRVLAMEKVLIANNVIKEDEYQKHLDEIATNVSKKLSDAFEAKIKDKPAVEPEVAVEPKVEE